MTQYRVRFSGEAVVREAVDADDAADTVVERIRERLRGADSNGVEVEITAASAPATTVAKEDG